MNDSMLVKLADSWKRLNPTNPAESPIDTLTAFVRDTEHELLSVATALQAHIDLLHDELERKNYPLDRFMVLNRSVDRIISGTTALATVSELAQAPRSKQKQTLTKLMKEIAQETLPAFKHSKVSLSCDITKGTTLTGNSDSLKILITEIVLALLHKCHQLETVNITGLKHRKYVSMSFDIGAANNQSEFKPWQLGKLRLVPMNGDGINLSAVEAMARLHRGHLSVSTLPDRRHGYRLNFQV